MAQYTLHRYSVDIKSRRSTVTSLYVIDNRGGSGVVAMTNKFIEPFFNTSSFIRSNRVLYYPIN